MTHEIHIVSVKHELAKTKFTFAVGATGGSGLVFQHKFLCWRLVVRQPRVRTVMCSGDGIWKRTRLNQNKFQVERRRKKAFYTLEHSLPQLAAAQTPAQAALSEPISSPKLSGNLIVRWRITTPTSRGKPARSCRQKPFRSPVQHQLQLLLSISSRLRKRLTAPLSCQL